MTIWQPIDTSPKDKDSKFIGLRKSGRAVTAVPHYKCIYGSLENGASSLIYIVFDGWQEDRGDALIPCDFTHWMPLPEPPEVRNGD